MTPDTLICIFCSATIADEMPVCLACNEYKGVMTLADFAIHYPEFYAEDFGDLKIL